MTTPITSNRHGDEVHPSFGKAVVSRVRCNPPVGLFDSSVQHSEFVSFTVHTATRKRDLHNDWIHADQQVLELQMSLFQWGALVSSFGQGDGVPVTLTYVDGERVPQEVHESRLAVTAKEVGQAARKATARVQAASEALQEAFARKAGRVEMAKLLRDLDLANKGLPENMKYAADQLTEHAEKVVTKAKADIEAMHTRAAAGSQLTSSTTIELEN